MAACNRQVYPSPLPWAASRPQLHPTNGLQPADALNNHHLGGNQLGLIVVPLVTIPTPFFSPLGIQAINSEFLPFIQWWYEFEEHVNLKMWMVPAEEAAECVNCC